jgi:hypothetical protein
VALAGPVLAVAVVLGLLIVSRLAIYHGDAAGFVLFGHHSAQYTHPPAGAPVKSRFGYDGQFYWIQANDPLLLHQSTLVDLHATNPNYGMQRVAYPALAYLLAAGRRGALPWSLLAVNVLSVLAITAAFAVYARRRGWSGWWALAIGLTPGLLMPSLRDLSDPLAVAAMLGGLLAWQGGRPWLAGGLLTVAALAREPMLIAAVAIGADVTWRSLRVRRDHAAVKTLVRRAWPPVVIPLVSYAGWQVYIHGRYSAGAAATSKPVLPPFRDFVNEVRVALHAGVPTAGMWDLVYVALMLAGIGAAIALLIRSFRCGQARVAAVAAVLFAAVLTVIVFGDQWGDTRYSAPLFAALLLGGLELRSRSALAVCAAVTAMTVVMPLALTGP